jgi:hypothetical protein
MEIKTLTVDGLTTALLSEDFWHTKILPITKHRALSYCHNPRADKDDPVLLVAYQDNRVIGYLGILPDIIFANDAMHKLGWLTSWWVDPSFASTGVGTVLLFKALNAYRQKLGVSGSSSAARKALDATQKFWAIKTLKGLDIKLRFNGSGSFLRKRPALKPLRLLLKLFDGLTDEIANFRSHTWQRHNAVLRPLTFEHISFIDEETDQFIQRHSRQDLTRKAAVDLNWIMSYPWILSAPRNESAGKKYYFSSRADRFFYLGVKVFEHHNGMVGFFLLNVRDDRMSVIFSYFDRRHALSIAAAAVLHALKMDVRVLRFYDELLVERFSELDCPHWSVKRVSRGFSLSKALADVPLTDCRLHGGDGDLAFY